MRVNSVLFSFMQPVSAAYNILTVGVAMINDNRAINYFKQVKRWRKKSPTKITMFQSFT